MELKTLPHRSAISGINYSPKSGHTVGSNLKNTRSHFRYFFRDERGLSRRAIFYGSRHNSRGNWRVSRELLNAVSAGIHVAYFSLFCFYVRVFRVARFGTRIEFLPRHSTGRICVQVLMFGKLINNPKTCCKKMLRTMSRLPKRNVPGAAKNTPDRAAVSESKIVNPKCGFGFQRPSKTPTTPSGKWRLNTLSLELTLRTCQLEQDLAEICNFRRVMGDQMFVE